MEIVKQINKALDSIGGTAEGNFKLYKTRNEAGETRTNLFLKAEKLPLKPSLTLSIDLPGDMDDLVVGGGNAMMNATGLGKPEPEPDQQSNN